MADRRTVVVFDRNAARRNEVYRVLARLAHVIPVADLADLGEIWPRDAWFLVPDDVGMLEIQWRAMMARATCHPVVVYAERPTTARALDAVMVGAVNYLPWPCSGDTLETGLRQISPAAKKRIDRLAAIWDARARLARLTEREREVVLAIRRGLSNKDVASSLGISPRTVEIHRASAIRRLGVSTTIDAVSLIIEAEQLSPFSTAS